MGRRGNWRTPTEPDGTPRNTDRRALRPQIHLFVAVFALLPLSFPLPLPTFPNTQRFGGFERIGVGWRVSYRRKVNGRGNSGSPRTPADPTELDGTPRSTKRKELLRQFHLFRVFNFAPLVFPFPPFPNTQSFGGFETPGIGRGVEYRAMG